MATEFERRYSLKNHPGTVRLLAFANRANMGNYQQAVDQAQRTGQPADIVATRDGDYLYKYGFGLNIEQEFMKNIGVFSRLGWSDGNNEAWVFSDVDRTATLGLSVKGELWRRPNDTFGLAGGLNGISKVHQEFLAAGGLGILAGDGALTGGWEQILETYYDLAAWKTVHITLDYQFVNHPAFNRDRGPVSVLGARLHWQF
jgi:high affinity Mn2+ porin